jgi:hypothetical protein
MDKCAFLEFKLVFLAFECLSRIQIQISCRQTNSIPHCKSSQKEVRATTMIAGKSMEGNDGAMVQR